MHLILVSDHAAVLVVPIDAAVEVVGTRLGDGIDGTTGEARLANVERGDADLQLLNGLHRESLRTSQAAVGTVRGKTEDVVGHSTIYLNGIIAVVRTGNAHGTTLTDPYEGVDAGHVGYAVSQRGELGNTVATNGFGSAVARSSQAGLTDDGDLAQ